MAVLKFYDTEDNFRKFHLTLKHQQCPHCKCYGTLNLHAICGGTQKMESPA